MTAAESQLVRPRAFQVLVGLASALGFSVWWWWRILTPVEFYDLNIINVDLYNEVVPRLEFAVRSLRAGHVPLWNPYQLCGTPFLAIQQHGLFYPLNLPHLVLPIGVALTCVAVAHYLVAFWSMFVLSRCLGLSASAAVVGGATYSLGGDLVGRFNVPPHLYAVAWLPFQLVLVRRLCQARRLGLTIVLLALVCALQFVGGHPQYCLYAAYMMAGYVACVALTTATLRAGARSAAALAAAAVLAAGLSAVQLLPSVELMLDSPRQPGSLAPLVLGNVTGGWPLLEGMLLFSRPLPGWARPASIGLVPLALAIAGCRTRLPRPDRLFFFVVLVVALVFGAGAFPWRLELLSHLPGAIWFRLPSRALLFASLALSVFAAAGTDRLLAQRSVTEAIKSLAPAVGGVLLFGAALAVKSVGAWEQYWRLAWLAGMPVAILLSPRRPLARRVLVVIAVLTELAFMHQNRMVIPHVRPAFLPRPERAITFLHAAQEQWRTYVTEQATVLSTIIPQVPVKLGMSAELYTIADYENLFPQAYAEFEAALQRQPTAASAAQGQLYASAGTVDRRLLDLTGVRFVLASSAAPFLSEPDPSYRLLRREPGFHLYENLQVMPRAFIVHAVAPVPDVAAAIRWLREGGGDLRKVATIEPPFQPIGGDDGGDLGEEAAWFALYEPEYVVIDFDATRPGFLILTDQFAPGWQARLDGESVPVHRADAVFRAVRVEPGSHRVEFVYAPQSFPLGLVLSLVSAAAGGLIVYRARR